MRFTITRDQRVPTPKRLAWAVVGLSFVLAGSAALAWQNGSGGKLRSTLVEEAEELSSQPPGVKAKPKPELPPSAAQATPAPVARKVSPAPAEIEVEATEEPETKAPIFNKSTKKAATTAPRVVNSNTTKPQSPAPARQPSERGSLLPAWLQPGQQDDASAPPIAKSPGRTENTNARNRTFSGSSKAMGGRATTKSTPKQEEPWRGRENPSVAAQKGIPTSPGMSLDIELPPVKTVKKSQPAPEKIVAAPRPAMKPAPKVAEAPIKKPAPVKPGPPRPTKIEDVELPLVTSVPRTLAPLNVPKITDVRPAGFQNVMPGETKLSGIAQQLGEPVDTEREGDTTILTYEVGPFPKVEVILAGDLVDSVVIHLKEAVEEKAVLTELGLGNFRVAPVTDEDGQVLGSAVPERGVALSYSGEARERKVAQVVLASVTAESFLMRALHDTGYNYQQSLADASYAAGFDPDSADAFAVQARVLCALGRVSEARAAIEAALKIDGGASDYRLLYARLLSQAGDYENALKMVETIATTASVEPQFVAQAELLWGDLLAHGPERDYPKAVEHHTRAIKLATELSQSPVPAVRSTALETLIDANLAVARDVALGNYKRKGEVVPKWLAKAETIKTVAIQEGASNYLQLRVAAKSLTACAALPEPFDPTAAVDTALSTAQELIAATEDPLAKQEIEWTLGVALVDAVQIEHTRGEFETAGQYANNALALLKENAGHREATPQRDYIVGRMFFALGAIYAVGKNDHAEAVHYYLQALPLFEHLPGDLADEQARHGERFVSMGVSFWQNGNKTQAVELTLAGTELLQDAVSGGWIDGNSLAVPYGNLSAMYKQLGKSGEATKFAELAQRLQEPKVKR